MDYSEWPPGTVGLYLDDCRTPRTNYYISWVVVRSVAEFRHYITQQGLPRIISFDHDLGYTMPTYDTSLEEGMAMLLPYVDTPQGRFRSDVQLEPSGYDAAKWLVDWCLDTDQDMPHFTCHSANPAGAENILHLLNNLQQTQGQEPNGYRTVW